MKVVEVKCPYCSGPAFVPGVSRNQQSSAACESIECGAMGPYRDTVNEALEVFADPPMLKGDDR